MSQKAHRYTAETHNNRETHWGEGAGTQICHRVGETRCTEGRAFLSLTKATVIQKLQRYLVCLECSSRGLKWKAFSKEFQLYDSQPTEIIFSLFSYFFLLECECLSDACTNISFWKDINCLISPITAIRVFNFG